MQQLIVQKYGGTSVGTTENIKAVARKVVATKQRGCSVVVVVSAMGKTTDELSALAREMSSSPKRRELDMLLTTGEQTSIALLVMAIQALGEDAVSLTGGQCGIVTNTVHANARILRIHTARLRRELERGAIVVVAGFQGVSEAGDITTLGRGGSDTTAAALAAALDAEACQIFTDVESVYSADPRVLAGRAIDEIHCEEMQEMAWHGAQVLKAEAVEFAKTNAVELEVRSTFGGGQGTRVRVDIPGPESTVFSPHRPAVAGVTGRSDLVRLTGHHSALEPGEWDAFFDRIAGFDLVFGAAGDGAGVDLLLSTQEIPNLEEFYVELGSRFHGAVTVDTGLGAVSLIGFGIGSRPKALKDALRVLRDAGFEVIQSFSGRESLSFLVDKARVPEGIRVLHRAFVESTAAPPATDSPDPKPTISEQDARPADSERVSLLV